MVGVPVNAHRRETGLNAKQGVQAYRWQYENTNAPSRLHRQASSVAFAVHASRIAHQIGLAALRPRMPARAPPGGGVVEFSRSGSASRWNKRKNLWRCAAFGEPQRRQRMRAGFTAHSPRGRRLRRPLRNVGGQSIMPRAPPPPPPLRACAPSLIEALIVLAPKHSESLVFADEM